jgi:hypothetical protein
MRPDLSFTSDTLLIRPWPDEVIDALGFDPRSPYVETYWLGILGPSTTWSLYAAAYDKDALHAHFIGKGGRACPE